MLTYWDLALPCGTSPFGYHKDPASRRSLDLNATVVEHACPSIPSLCSFFLGNHHVLSRSSTTAEGMRFAERFQILQGWSPFVTNADIFTSWRNTLDHVWSQIIKMSCEPARHRSYNLHQTILFLLGNKTALPPRLLRHSEHITMVRGVRIYCVPYILVIT